MLRVDNLFSLTLVVALLFFLNIGSAEAATAKVATKTTPKQIPLEVSGWVPYWRKATGTQEAIMHIDSLKEINLFGYTVKQDGSLFDPLKVGDKPWTCLIALAQSKKVRVIPTVM